MEHLPHVFVVALRRLSEKVLQGPEFLVQVVVDGNVAENKDIRHKKCGNRSLNYTKISM